MAKIHIQGADNLTLQHGTIEIAAKETNLHVIKTINRDNNKADSYYAIRDESGHNTIATFRTAGWTTLKAEADSREQYTVLRTLFEKAHDYGQDCHIKKNFVEACDLKKAKKLGVVGRVLRRGK